MNEIKIFNNSQFGEIRTAKTENGEPLFCLVDLCAALKLTNNRKVKSQLDDDVTLSYPIIDSLGRNQDATFVTESGMYTVILRSDSPLAKPMQKWVTSEVLPAIRKHGGYLTSQKIEEVLLNPDMIIQMATALKEERSARELAQKQLQHQAPIIQYANEVLSSTSSHTATTIGAELNMSAQTLNRLLVKAKFLRKTGSGKKAEYSLCASRQGRGYVATQTFKYSHEDEKTGVTKTGTRIEIRFTEAGRMKIHEIFKRAVSASVIVERKGRYFINDSWKESESAA